VKCEFCHVDDFAAVMFFFSTKVNCGHYFIIIKELLQLWLFACSKEASSFVAVGEVILLRFVGLLLVEQHVLHT